MLLYVELPCRVGRFERLEFFFGRIATFLVRTVADDDFLNHYILHRLIPKIASHLGDSVNDFLSFDYLSENAVLAVKPRRRFLRDEELAAVSIGAGICH